MPECFPYAPFYVPGESKCYSECPIAFPVTFENTKECITRCPLYNPINCTYDYDTTYLQIEESCTFRYCVDMCPPGRENTNGICTDIIKPKSMVPLIVGTTLGVFFAITLTVIISLALYMKRKTRLRNRRESLVVKIEQKGAKWG